MGTSHSMPVTIFPGADCCSGFDFPSSAPKDGTTFFNGTSRERSHRQERERYRLAKQGGLQRLPAAFTDVGVRPFPLEQEESMEREIPLHSQPLTRVHTPRLQAVPEVLAGSAHHEDEHQPVSLSRAPCPPSDGPSCESLSLLSTPRSALDSDRASGQMFNPRTKALRVLDMGTFKGSESQKSPRSQHLSPRQKLLQDCLCSDNVIQGSQFPSLQALLVSILTRVVSHKTM